MTPVAEDVINWTAFAETRGALGEAFVRILGYFREDGTKSVAEIENAMRERSSAKLVLPAHTLERRRLSIRCRKACRIGRRN